MTFDPMVFVLVLTMALIAYSFWQAHKNPLVDFNVFDLLMENGRVSKVACMVLGSFIMTTWMMVHLTIHDKMTEGYMTTYMAAWIAPLIAKMFVQPAVPKEDKP
jgi:hypothetical protein